MAEQLVVIILQFPNDNGQIQDKKRQSTKGRGRHPDCENPLRRRFSDSPEVHPATAQIALRISIANGGNARLSFYPCEEPHRSPATLARKPREPRESVREDRMH